MSATVNLPSSAHEFIRRAAESSATCVSATPDKNGYVPPEACNAFFDYYPSFALAAAFTAVFLIVSLAHIFQAFHHKKGFCAVIIMGALWEAASFLLRTAATKHQQNKQFVNNSFILFALAPLWINAFVYMVAGRMIFCFHPEKRVWKLKAILIGRIFIICDILAFLVQLGGALMIQPSASTSTKKNGLHIYQAGIGVQQAFILIFMAIIIGFHKSMLDMEKRGWRDEHHRKWKLMIFVLYFVLLMITTRIIYRLCEYLIPQNNNPLLTHEFYMYVLDAVPMLLALLALNAVHPGRVLVGPESNYREGKKQQKADAKAAKKARKEWKMHGGDDESMIGLVQQPAPMNTPYAAVSGGHEYGVVSDHSATTLYDPHHGRM